MSDRLRLFQPVDVLAGQLALDTDSTARHERPPEVFSAVLAPAPTAVDDHTISILDALETTP